MINFMHMVENIIAELFTNRVGRWQGEFAPDVRGPTERKALLVLFKIGKKSVRMLIHAPANYVGVYIQKGKLNGSSYGKWDCVCYHDSCWRSDGVDRFLWENHEDIHFCIFPNTKGFDTIETLTDAIHIIKLDEVQLDGFRQIRKKKYN
jgi:hypothetical protein